jgi:tyrosinase
MGVRKNQALLTADEKQRFVAALKALKSNGMYDMMVEEHRTAVLSSRPDPAHLGPAFFAWHRECLRRFELHLQAVDPRITLPYWDWTRDRSARSTIWDPEFMGGNGRSSDQMVTTGPFAYPAGEWTLTVNDLPETPPYLRRAFGVSDPVLPASRRLSSVLSTVPYDASPWNFQSDVTQSFRNRAERDLHNLVHRWVGGTMMEASSPNDPVFWLHHCQLDRLWAMWQNANPRQARYRPAEGAATGHNLDDPMWPWSLPEEPEPPTPRTVLRHRDLGYSYDDESSW